jgi:lysophospholipase L1-like esterase
VRRIRPEVRFDMMAVDDTQATIIDGVEIWREKYPRYEPEDIRRAAADPNAFTILGLGDSIMHGGIVPKEQTYLEHTRRALAQRVSKNVAVLNLAVPGYNTMQENVVYGEIESQIRPNLVIVHYWTNDIQQLRFVGGYVVNAGDVSEDGHLVVRALPLPPRLNDFLLMRSYLYSFASRVVANWWVSRDADWTRVTEPMLKIHERAERGGARLLILASPGLDRQTAEPTYELPQLREFAARHGIEVVDLSEWLRGIDARTIAMDSCHFNERGHQLVGERLATHLLNHEVIRRELGVVD